VAHIDETVSGGGGAVPAWDCMSAADNVGIGYAKRNVTDLTRPLERMKSPSVT